MVMIREMCRKVTDLGRFGRRTLVYSLIREAGEAEYGVGIAVAESGERAEIHGVTPDRARAERLVDLLATYYVTPVALEDVVRDWLER